MQRNYEKIYEELLLDGFFSEYLPPCFKLNKLMFEKIPKDNCDLIKPYSFTMSRFNANDSRRTIFIPEIGSYAVLNNYIKNNKILEDMMDLIYNNQKSFSKIIMEDGSVRKHEQVYGGEIAQGEKINSQYIDNVVKKLKISAGAKKVLKLDIANCFSSFYTHYIPVIILGYEAAEDNYKNKLRNTAVDPNYTKYSKLDSIIRKQNKNQTNGLLVGPIMSNIIVEGLLSRIDEELESKKIVFTRYVDDYEVYLFEENEEYIKSIFVSILKKYDLSLNFEKVEILDFPYYTVDNFDKILELYKEEKIKDYDLIQLFNDFFKIEKSGTKGAIRYLLKSLEKNPITVENKDLFDSYMLTIMSNNSRSLTKACSLLLKNNMENKVCEKHIEHIKKMIEFNIKKEYDLEVLWLLYVLIETKKIKKNEQVVDMILQSKNELAKIMILRRDLTSRIDIIKQDARSWILNYELFSKNLIDIEELCERIPLDKNKEMYENLKKKNLHFCY